MRQPTVAEPSGLPGLRGRGPHVVADATFLPSHIRMSLQVALVAGELRAQVR
ncbi:hypothetical protein [Kribbella sp. VKM Ac-2568]|uniref:hypothetical protein n=1 Tax=Kribbella sp. VKM Ac-2568 TaxID=2512219 RepID=UPI0013053DC1|nr:hypothetical protein [Kribbella sp. VKM Ac-2568]